MIPKSRPVTDPRIAEDVQTLTGKPVPPASTAVPDPNESKATAAAYEQMQHAPHDPQVKASYEAMKKEIKRQWDHLVARGVRFTPWTQPGQSSREEALRQLHAAHNPVKLSMGGMNTMMPLAVKQLEVKQYTPGMEPPTVTQYKPGMQPPAPPAAPTPVALGNSLNRGHVVTFSRPGTTAKVTRTVTTTLGPEQLHAKLKAAGYTVHSLVPSTPESHQSNRQRTIREVRKLARVTATRLNQQGIHRAFRGTALAYHLLKLADHARERYGAKANPLLLQIRGVLAGKKELNLKQFGDKVSPFAAVGRYLKQLGGHAVPEELHGLADRFKWTTSDRRHDLDRQVYDLAADKWGEHRADDGIREMFRRLHRGSDQERRGITDAFKKHLKVELPSGDHHQEIMDSIARLHSYAQDRRMVREGGGKTKGGNVHWKDWFEQASNPFAKKRSDPMRLSRPADEAELHRKVLDDHPTGLGAHRMAMADDLLERGLLHDDDSFHTIANHNGAVALYPHPDSGKIHAHPVEGDQRATSEAVRRLMKAGVPGAAMGLVTAGWDHRGNPKAVIKAKYRGPGERFIVSRILSDGTVAAYQPFINNITHDLATAKNLLAGSGA